MKTSPRWISMVKGEWKEVEARPIKSNHGLDLFCYPYSCFMFDGYIVTEGTTGMQLFGRRYIRDCTEAELILELAYRGLTIEHLKEQIFKRLADVIKNCGEKPASNKAPNDI